MECMDHFLSSVIFFWALGRDLGVRILFFIIRRRYPLPRPGNLFHLINSCVRVVFGGPTGAGKT